MLRIILLSLFVVTFASAAAAKPNILFVLIDDMGARDLDCYGSKFYRTPNIDRLAQQGMKFTHGYAACSVCSPSRAAIMTGKYPARLHLTDWLPGRTDRPDQPLARPVIHQQLPLEETTLAEALKEEGYTTGHIGKWHLGDKGFLPEDQGFDVNIAGTKWGYPFGWFPPYERKLRNGDTLKIPDLDNVAEGTYLTDALNDAAVRFIEYNHDKPFFLHLSHYTVHIPLDAPKDLIARYPTLTDQRGKQTNAVYAAMIESLDTGLGRVFAKLEEMKIADNTIVVFTSDNGGLCTLEGRNTPATYNAPFREGKGFIYEGGLRVPYIVKWPGKTKSGSVSEVPVCGIDFFPTLLKAAGVKSSAKVDGTDLTPVLDGSKKDLNRRLYWHYPHYSNQGGKPAGALRQGKWKLIQNYEDGRLELYDVSKGREGRNVVGSEAVVARSMMNALEAMHRETGAQMMLPYEDYRPNAQQNNGPILLAARTANIHGTMLRYEPMPHKNTVGYWVNESDRVSWNFTIQRPGTYEVIATQGCGPGQGGSQVEFAVGDEKLMMTVEDTGHFQNFVERNIGRIKLKTAGRHTLMVSPRKKAKNAVMDLRRVLLRPVK